MEEDTGSPDTSTLVATVLAMWQSAASLFQQIAELAKLEARLAARAIIAIVVMGVLMLLLVTTAWLLLSGAAAVWLTQWGFSWASALAIMAGFNLACVVVLLLLVRQLAKRLAFQHTRKALRIRTGSHDEHEGTSPLSGSGDRQQQASA